MQIVGVSVVSVLLGLVSGWLYHSAKTSIPTTPVELIKNCSIVGNPKKEIWLYTASTDTDHAYFASLDHKYKILFPSASPFITDPEFDKQTSPVDAVLKGNVHSTCDSCPHDHICSHCYFSFTILNEDTTPPTSCPDPGVHITR
jgi:hypothetical protein